MSEEFVDNKILWFISSNFCLEGSSYNAVLEFDLFPHRKCVS